jgi:hypothetical protein
MWMILMISCDDDDDANKAGNRLAVVLSNITDISPIKFYKSVVTRSTLMYLDE